MSMKCDFQGWATRNNIRCADGKTIRQNAFKDQNGKRVPLVWQHRHDSPENVLGHAILENREDGVWAYCNFNDTENAKHCRELVKHGDISSLSIWANHLTMNRGDVLHGIIREVSLVLAGANPGATILSPVLEHGEEDTTEATIYTGMGLELGGEVPEIVEHSDEEEALEKKESESEEIRHEDDGPEETIEDVINSMSEDEKNAMSFIIATVVNKDNLDDKIVASAFTASEKGKDSLLDVYNKMSEKKKNVIFHIAGMMAEEENQNESKNDNSKEEEKEMNLEHRNVFEESEEEVIVHSEDIRLAISEGKKYGSLKESFIAHGIENIGELFPEAKNPDGNIPVFIQRPTGWVPKVMGGVHHTPFSRIKSMFADITGDDARAKGYMKGNLKKEEVFSLLKRTTPPTTIYKKQKLDRDDVIDITDFDVIAWIKAEMRMMLDEEIARAILVGDGRLASSDDKIDEGCIRPVWKDAELYTIKVRVPTTASEDADDKVKNQIRAIIKARKNYRGSGEPTLFTTEDWLTDALLLEDGVGRPLYDDVNKLATKLRVKEIVTVPVMENLTREEGGITYGLVGLVVNLKDYNVGADKGGAVNMFDDFDIDYNKMIYLIETRCSGALTVPYSAMAIESYIASGE